MKCRGLREWSQDWRVESDSANATKIARFFRIRAGSGARSRTHLGLQSGSSQALPILSTYASQLHPVTQRNSSEYVRDR